MEKFSNDPIENVAINALPNSHTNFRTMLFIRDISFKTVVLRYYTNEKKWQWGNVDIVFENFVKLNWTDPGAKEGIIDFLCKAKPELEREFLRAKSELDLTKKTDLAL